MDRKYTVKWITTAGILGAIEVALQFLGNITYIGPININLALIPIGVAAILLGPLGGLFVGMINGFMVIWSQSTLAIFMPINAIATVLICFLKSSLAGVIAGLVYWPFKNKSTKVNLIGMVLSSLLVPVVNTGIFAIGSTLFFRSFLVNFSENLFIALIIVIGWNFLVEFGTSAVLSPAICKVVGIIQKRESN